MSVINRFEVDIDNAIGFVRRCQVSDPSCPEVVWLMIDLGRRIFVSAWCDRVARSALELDHGKRS